MQQSTLLWIVTVTISFLVVSADLDSIDIETSACVDDEGFVERHEYCEYSCQVTGLNLGDYITIEKALIRSYTITTHAITNIIHVTYNATRGLNPALEATGRYEALQYDNSSVTVNITDALPEDSGGYRCAIRNKDGERIKTSNRTFISVLGVAVEPSISPSGQELNLTKEELRHLVYSVFVNGALPIVPNGRIVVKYLDTGFEEDVTQNFDHRGVDLSTAILEGGLVYGTVREVFDKPESPAFIETNKGKPTLIGIYEYAHHQYTSNVTINLLFKPNVTCEKIDPVVIGDSLTVHCEFSANPAAESFSLKLPNGQVVNTTSPDEDVYLSVTPLQVEWMYKLAVTYQNISDVFIGQHTLNIRNMYGESASTFVITEVQVPTTESSNMATPARFPCLTSLLSSFLLLAFVIV